MYEMMIDLETLDTRPKAIVLSVGAVIWETFQDEDGNLSYHVWERFLRRPEIDPQVIFGRTISEETLLWWQKQTVDARAEAFDKDRQPIGQVMIDLKTLAGKYDVNHFWASPDTFDFPIMESLAEDVGLLSMLPWSYRQKYDVRTVVNEASYSASAHKAEGLAGVPHTPVFDCEWQIDLLTAARVKIGRRVG